jgi:transposase
MLGEHLEKIRALHVRCEGNLVRVHEELEADGVEVAYSSLTAFCRRKEIGQRTKKRTGRYHFEPGEEMQHDTSPHVVTVGGKRLLLQCASLVLCYSRIIFAMVYFRWRRFECRCFLTEALKYINGAAGRCMLDNSSVIIVHGNGRDATPADSMIAFGKRFGFHFAAHELGDANRSARVERPFDYIERNFYVGRDFVDLDDVNAQLRAWCDKVNNRAKRTIPKTPFEMLAVERPHLRALPPFVPEIYRLHTRRVDTEGYVTVDTNCYSMPTKMIGRQVEVRESMTRIRIFDGHQLVVEHARLQPGSKSRSVKPEHAYKSGRLQRTRPSEQELLLSKVSPTLGELVARLRKHYGGQALRAVRRLHKMYLDYPTNVLVEAVTEALAYDLHDLGRIEQMVLRRIRGEYFRLPTDDEEPPKEAQLEPGFSPKKGDADDEGESNDDE